MSSTNPTTSRQVHAWESLLPRAITITHAALFAAWRQGQLVRDAALLVCGRYARGTSLGAHDVLGVLVDLEAVQVDELWLVTPYPWPLLESAVFAEDPAAHERTWYRLDWLVREARKRHLWERFELLRWADLIEQSHEVLP